ncbi:MAG: hypothetical protein ACT4OM_07725 [Actinomycetota bacterium]
MPQGSVKEYHVNEKVGIIVSDDGATEWAIDPVAIDQGMFRFFRLGQRVTFDLIDEDGQVRARNLRIGVL